MEYESRRDADDAYHEMHNKRIGRDDLLKIEVSRQSWLATPGADKPSGPALLHRPRGASTRARPASATNAFPAAATDPPAAAAPLPAVAATTLPRARTTVASATTIAVTATAPGARMATAR